MAITIIYHTNIIYFLQRIKAKPLPKLDAGAFSIIKHSHISQYKRAYREMDCKRFATVRSSPDLYFVGNIRALQFSSGTFNVFPNALEGINFILFSS